MLSKNKIKLLQSLSMKKHRDDLRLFVAEGHKIVTDLSDGFDCMTLIFTEKFNSIALQMKASEKIMLTTDEYLKISSQQNPQGIMGVFNKREDADIRAEMAENELILMLEDIQDPGNLGTIIRIADWFGIRKIICSPGTADVYNPKVVQASMGALVRVQLMYTSIPDFLQHAPDINIYGTILSGNNIYHTKLSASGIIVMGNEGKGISPETEKCLTHKLFIPSFPPGESTSESLNVAVATAIVCSEFRRT